MKEKAGCCLSVVGGAFVVAGLIYGFVSEFSGQLDRMRQERLQEMQNRPNVHQLHDQKLPGSPHKIP